MIGIDTNLLVAISMREHPIHLRAVEAFERELAAGEEIVLSSAVAAEFLHVITDPRRVMPPRSMAEAISWLRAWDLEIMPRWITTDATAVKLSMDWMEKLQLGRKRITDTQYAATLHQAGIRRLLTNNTEDFQAFGAFEIVPF
jgi:predicted nucleic acid-binding protein